MLCSDLWALDAHDEPSVLHDLSNVILLLWNARKLPDPEFTMLTSASCDQVMVSRRHRLKSDDVSGLIGLKVRQFCMLSINALRRKYPLISIEANR